VPAAIALLAAAAAAATAVGSAQPQAQEPNWIPPTGVTAAISPPTYAKDVPATGFASPPTPRDTAGDPNQTICKRIATTGTRFPITDCRSRAEWNQLAVDSRQAAHDMSDRQGGLTAQGIAGMQYNGK
jgi:hypothetical protein